MLGFMNCATISEASYYVYQKKYLHQAIKDVWEEQQSNMIALLQAYDKPLSLGGDGRCDSPGFSAKYGTYTFMELEHNAILHIELVQVYNVNKIIM
jgi:solute carrier family 8 (sodium/calcium exchanger)